MSWTQITIKKGKLNKYDKIAIAVIFTTLTWILYFGYRLGEFKLWQSPEMFY